MPAKPHLKVGSDGKLRTASEVARERELARHNLTMEWYQDKVVEQSNLCAVCGKAETKRNRYRGEILGLSLDPETHDRLVCQSCAGKVRSKKARERVAKRNDRGGAESGDQFWVRNRNALSEPERVQFEARDEEIILLWDELKKVLQVAKAGIEFEEQALRDFIREVCSEVIGNGMLLIDLVLTDFFRPHRKDFYDTLVAEGGSTAIFVQYGYITALPSSDTHRFLEFAEKHLGLPISGCESYSTRIERIYDALDGKIWNQPDHVIRCKTQGCKETKNLPPYEIPSPQWWCPTHQAALDKAAREASSRLSNQRIAEQQRDSVRDSYGRFKDRSGNTIFGEDGPYGPTN